MKEFEVTTQGELHRSLPKGVESDWVEFARLPVIGGKLRVSDPMFYNDLPPSPTFEVESGEYRILAKSITFPGDIRVSRLRAILYEPCELGRRLDDVGVDFAQVGLFDPLMFDEVGDNLSTEEQEKLLADLDAIQEFGVVQFGSDARAIMALASSGFGDGGYPIHELTLDGKRVGLEVVFIGPELLVD